VSQVGKYSSLNLPIQFITGNGGGAVGPDGTGNINLVGTDPITVTGTPLTNTLTITVATATTAQIGVTTLATDAETIAGVVTDNAVVPSGLAAKLGVQTLFGVPYGNTTAGAIQWTVPGNNGQLLIGSTAAAPAFGTLTSPGGTIVFAPGPNTLELKTGGTVATSFTTDDANVIVPLAGNVNVLGAHGINTTGTIANTITIAINNTITLGNLVNVTGADALTLTTGDATITAGNINMTDTNAAGTIGIINYSGDRFIHNYGIRNTFVGSLAGNTTLGVLAADNVGIGYSALSNLTNGLDNTGVGWRALGGVTTGDNNTGIGYGVLLELATGISNTVLGWRAGAHLVAGSSNTLLGYNAGANYNAVESSNIVIGTNGTVGDNHTIRIGEQGGADHQQNLCYIAGITGVNVGNVASVVSIATGTGQLGTTTITAGAGISVTATAGTITIAAAAIGFAWTVEAVNMNMVVNHGYIANKAGTLELTLPAVSAVGDTVRVTGMNTALGWQIKQNAGNTIYYNGGTTTPGIGGSITSSAIHDSVELICLTANALWQVVSGTGNVTIV
jgi:hypothetical protein